MSLKTWRVEMANKLGMSTHAFTAMVYNHKNLYYPRVKRINSRVVLVLWSMTADAMQGVMRNNKWKRLT